MRYWFWICLLVSIGGVSNAQLNSLQTQIQGRNSTVEYQARQFITHLYQEYYLRFPSPAEVEVWMQGFRRGESLEQIHAAFLGSDEYFNRNGRNNLKWLSQMFLTVNNRQPNQDDLNYWSQRLRRVNNDRRRLAEEFLRTQMGGVASGPNYDPSYGTLPSPPAVGNLSTQLVTSAQQLSQSVRNEFSSWRGTIIQLQANNLLDLAQRSRTTLNNSNRDPVAAQTAMQRIAAAVQGLNIQFRSVSGGINSRFYLDQVNRIQRTLSDYLNSVDSGGRPVQLPNQPPVVADGLTRQEARRLARTADRLVDQLKQTYGIVQDLARYNYRYSALVHDLGRLTADAQNLDNSIEEGFSKIRLQNQASQMRGRVQNIAGRLHNQTIDVRLSQSWSTVIQSFNELTNSLGSLGGFNPGVGTSDPVQLRSLYRAIDQSITYTDLLLYQFKPYNYYGGDYSRFSQETRELRNSLSDFRSSLTPVSSSASIRAGARKVNNSYRAVERAWNAMLRNTGMVNTNGLTNLSNAMEQLMSVASAR